MWYLYKWPIFTLPSFISYLRVPGLGNSRFRRQLLKALLLCPLVSLHFFRPLLVPNQCWLLLDKIFFLLAWFVMLHLLVGVIFVLANWSTFKNDIDHSSSLLLTLLLPPKLEDRDLLFPLPLVLHFYLPQSQASPKILRVFLHDFGLLWKLTFLCNYLCHGHSPYDICRNYHFYLVILCIIS